MKTYYQKFKKFIQSKIKICFTNKLIIKYNFGEQNSKNKTPKTALVGTTL